MEKTIEDGLSNPESKVQIKKKTQEFETIIRHYLESNPALKQNNKTSELEIRFGTNPRSAGQISKIDYDNVVKQLYACGFKTDKPEGLQILRIQNEYADAKTGTTRMSNIRAEIVGLDLIQEYCRTNNLQRLIDLPSTASATAPEGPLPTPMPLRSLAPTTALIEPFPMPSPSAMPAIWAPVRPSKK